MSTTKRDDPVGQYVRALEKVLRILGFDPAKIEVYADGSLTKECKAELSATTEIKIIRAKYEIPNTYFGPTRLDDGSLMFNYCDSDITVYPDGSCTERHMGLSADCSGHQFYTQTWP